MISKPTSCKEGGMNDGFEDFGFWALAGSSGEKDSQGF
jgi:hypothetical protein